MINYNKAKNNTISRKANRITNDLLDLNDNLNNLEDAVETDKTLSVEDKPADAKTVGDGIFVTEVDGKHHKYVVSGNRGNIYIEENFEIGKTYRIRLSFDEVTPPSSGIFLNVRTTNINPISTVDDIVEEISGEYRGGKREFVWAFVPQIAAKYLYVFISKVSGTVCSYTLIIDKIVKDVIWDFNKKLNQLTKQVYLYDHIYISFYRNGINEETGAVITETNKLVTKDALFLREGTRIVCSDNSIYITAYYYGDNRKYTDRIDINTDIETEYRLPKTGFYRIKLTKSDETDFDNTQVEYETYESKVSVFIPLSAGNRNESDSDSSFRFTENDFLPYASYTRNTEIAYGEAILLVWANNNHMTCSFSKFSEGLIECPDGYTCRYIITDEQNRCIKGLSADYSRVSFHLEPNQKIFFRFAKSGSGTINESDLTNLVNGVVIYNNRILNGIDYDGDKINLSKNALLCKHLFKITRPSGVNNSIQGIAVYENVLLQGFDGGYWAMYDLAALTATPFANGLLDGATSSLHANSCCFGDKYDSDDDYPLLYTTGGKAGATNPGGENDNGYCVVHRFVPNNDTYDTELIQTIYIDWSGFVAKGFHEVFVRPNFVIENGYLYTFSALYRTDGSMSAYDNVNRFVVHKYKVPALSDATVILTADDAIDELLFDYDTFYMQGATIYNDLLMHTFGLGGNAGRKNAIRIYNVISRTEVAKIDGTLLPYKTAEPEGLAVYNGKLLANIVSGDVYEISFD